MTTVTEKRVICVDDTYVRVVVKAMDTDDDVSEAVEAVEAVTDVVVSMDESDDESMDMG